jgi:4-amino-4-deoxy-L-arabinose transferase-like glycosyltransferase
VSARRFVAAWQRPAMALVLALAVFLDFFRLSQNGYANTYYAAAVRSMLRSWRNFFFVSFDPGGLVSVDKPPLALWLQAASAKLFGYSGFTILLPEALAGVAAVWVLYLLVTRWFGRTAGLVAALALAVSPVSVAVNRDNNPDALLALLLVLALYVGARAIESGHLRTLLLSAAIVGLAFNTKMMAALIVVPGLVLGYFAFAPGSWRRRSTHLLAAAAILVAVSGAWIAAVELTSAADRPYVGSTTDNSALSLAFDYNGLGRVLGQTGGTSFGAGGGAFSGTPGWMRLFNDSLGDQGAWLLPLALVGSVSTLLGLALAWRRHRRELGILAAVGGWFVSAAAIFSFSSGIIHTYYISALAPATSALVGVGAVALWRNAHRSGGWILLPLAAVALSVWAQVDLLRRSGYLAWLQVLVIAVAVVTGVLLLSLALPGRWAQRPKRLVTTIAIAGGIGSLLVAPAAWSATTFRSAVSGVFPGAGPNYVSGLTSPSRNGPGSGGFGLRNGRQPLQSPQFPGRADGGRTRQSGGMLGAPSGDGGPDGSAGPGSMNPDGFAGPGGDSPGGGGSFGQNGGSAGSSGIAAALAYVEAHGAAARFGLIVQSEQEAASFVIEGEPIAAMGGFTGRETVLTPSYLARLVRSGEARYFLLGGNQRGGPGGTSNAAVDTIGSTCKAISSSKWSGGSSSAGTLYDCAGKADAIAAAG